MIKNFLWWRKQIILQKEQTVFSRFWMIILSASEEFGLKKKERRTNLFCPKKLKQGE